MVTVHAYKSPRNTFDRYLRIYRTYLRLYIIHRYPRLGHTRAHNGYDNNNNNRNDKENGPSAGVCRYKRAYTICPPPNIHVYRYIVYTTYNNNNNIYWNRLCPGNCGLDENKWNTRAYTIGYYFFYLFIFLRRFSRSRDTCSRDPPSLCTYTYARTIITIECALAAA